MNEEGVEWVLGLFEAIKAPEKLLIVRQRRKIEHFLQQRANDFRRLLVQVIDYFVPLDRSYEAFHCKVVIADEDVAYVGSANLLVYGRQSMELGVMIEGAVVKSIASLLIFQYRCIRAREGMLVVQQDESVEILSKVIRRARRQIAKGQDPCAYCLNLIDGDGPPQLQTMVDRLVPEERDHAIATIYTLLLDQKRRKELGAYFTPPHLVDHLLLRLEHFGLDILGHRIHDPAAGGAAFIVPLVRRVVTEVQAAGIPSDEIPDWLCGRLTGMELDEGLAVVANSLMRRMLRDEFGLPVADDFSLISQGNSLEDEATEEIDVLIGNPPYGKVGAKGNVRWREEFSDIAGGQLNLYSMFVRQGLDRLKPGGLMGFVIPMSFIGSPEFKGFRSKVTEMADVLVLDLIEKRTYVFVDVIQDTAIIVLRRKSEAQTIVVPITAIVRSDGSLEELGAPKITTDGKPWKLPSTAAGEGGFRLADYGYRATVGHLVANRQPDRLREGPGEGIWPLVWAKAVTPSGGFDHARGIEHVGKIWVEAPAEASYIMRKACVVLQRTSNRKQKRRLNAAAIPQTFIDNHGGVVGENHVIFLVDKHEPRIDPERLTILMNSASVNRRFESMCGTISVSAKLLAEVDLPDPALLAEMPLDTERAEEAIAAAYHGEIVAPVAIMKSICTGR